MDVDKAFYISCWMTAYFLLLASITAILEMELITNIFFFIALISLIIAMVLGLLLILMS